MSATLEMRKRGLEVLVLDRQPEPGGQVWRDAGSVSDEQVRFFGSEYEEGRGVVRAFEQSGAEFMGGAHVWHILPENAYVSINAKSFNFRARQILIASGGMERPVPVPGWTLPGVIGAGAADVLLKSSGLAPDGPVILCGNGPLILQTLVHLRHLRIPLAGLVLTGKPSNTLNALSAFPQAFLRPLYLARGMGFGLQALLGRCHSGSRDVRIEKDGEEFTVSFNSLGKKRTLKGGTVLLHEGVVSENHITRLARCRHVWDSKQRYWHVATDDWGRTNVPGVWAGGDCAGVRGVDAAVAKGKMAGLGLSTELGRVNMAEGEALAASPRRTLFRCAAMQAFTDRLFAPNPEQLQPADDAIVCRCEELTAGELRESIRSGCFSSDALKAQSRVGMGTCQGRMCSAAVAEMIAQIRGLPLESLEPFRVQPPLLPLSLGELANMDMPVFGM